MKMNLKSLLSSTLLALTISGTVLAADSISIGMPAYGGNGCPAGTASAVLSQDAKSLSLIFDQFVVDVGGANRSLDRKSCNVAIPVHVPQGFSVSVISVDYRGYVSLPSQGSARLTAEYFLAGVLTTDQCSGIVIKKNTVDPKISDIVKVKIQDQEIEAKEFVGFVVQ